MPELPARPTAAVGATPSIVVRVAVLFVPVALALCIASLLSYRSESGRIVAELVDQGRESVRVVSGQLVPKLALLASDALYLGRSHALRGYLREGNAQALHDLEEDWLSFAETRGIYDQIRLIDVSGQEQVRINFTAGGATIVPRAALQFKGERYYVRDSLALPPGGIYASRLDLNIEHGVVEKPVKPMMRIGTPVEDESGRRRGLVLLNYLGRDILSLLERPGGAPLWLLDADGYWLRGPTEEVEWGFMFGAGGLDIRSAHPLEWARMVQQESGDFQTDKGIFVFATIRPLGLLAAHGGTVASGGSSHLQEGWKLVDFVPRDQVDEALGRLQWLYGGATLLVLVALALGAYRSGRAMIAEASAMTRLEDSNRQLERRVAERTRELTGEVEVRRKSEAQLAHQAAHDGLTGLANRASAASRFADLAPAAVQAGEEVALVFIDLDNFKLVNDTLGHASGDELLRLVARRLKHGARDGDLLARYGGDEFLLLMRFSGQQGDLEAALGRLGRSFDDPFGLGNHELRLSASMGIGVHPADGGDWESLMKAADTALYAAKRSGKGQHCYFSTTLADELHDRFEIERELRRALANGEVQAHFQPKIDGEGLLCGFEALARWTSPTRGPISPDRFIRVAEETGLIVELGRQMLRQACREAAAWRALRDRPLSVAVNLSSRQFDGDDLPALVDSVLSETGLPAGLLELEVTESMLMQDTQATVQVLAALRRRGIRISVDDFGTGYSSLSYLRELPIDRLKIDRSFVTGCEQDGPHMVIPHAVIFLGKSLNLSVIAEGVEQASQYEILRRCGCDEFQGYWVSRPLDAAAASRFAAHGFRPDDAERRRVDGAAA